MSASYIAVVGGGEIDDDLRATARAIGRGLAEAGVVVVCGGLGETFEALMAGVTEADGTTVAILPGHSRESIAADATVSIPTGLGEARNVLIVRSCQAMIAVGGGFGTLSELALAARAGIPIVGYRTWSLQPAHIAGADDPVIPTTTAEDAVAVATALTTG